ncbi:MAG: GNAT family N-acetyltransferase [Hyphomicrobiaceae bacterium]
MTPQPQLLSDVRQVGPADLEVIADLHRAAFGPGRFARSAYRVREGTAPFTPHCRVAVLGNRLVAALRMTEVAIGGRHGALLLGPVAVAPDLKGQGHGRNLIARTLDAAHASGFGLVVLVGDLSYYGRFGFVTARPGSIRLPGPVDPTRILVLELKPGTLAEYSGLVAAAHDNA